MPTGGRLYMRAEASPVDFFGHIIIIIIATAAAGIWHSDSCRDRQPSTYCPIDAVAFWYNSNNCPTRGDTAGLQQQKFELFVDFDQLKLQVSNFSVHVFPLMIFSVCAYRTTKGGDERAAGSTCRCRHCHH